MGGILRGLKIIRLIITANQNEYVPVPLLHCRICNVLVRIRIRNPNPDPDPDPPQKGKVRQRQRRLLEIFVDRVGLRTVQF
jgi:hypothetical protein